MVFGQRLCNVNKLLSWKVERERERERERIKGKGEE
jgi:hypothetical protein